MTLKSTSDKGLQTLSIHAGETPDSASGASAPSLVMSSTFVVDEEVSFSANNLTSDSPCCCRI
jgi:methionine-gamma-lyase